MGWNELPGDPSDVAVSGHVRLTDAGCQWACWLRPGGDLPHAISDGGGDAVRADPGPVEGLFHPRAGRGAWPSTPGATSTPAPITA